MGSIKNHLQIKLVLRLIIITAVFHFHPRLADKHVPQCDLSPPSLLHVHENVLTRAQARSHQWSLTRTQADGV